MLAVDNHETKPAQLRVLVVGERASVGQGLRTLLQGDPDVVSVDWVREVGLVERVVLANRPDVLLMDLSTGPREAVAVIGAIGRIPHPPAVVVLVDSPRSYAAVEAVRAGAVSVVTMADCPEDLIAAIRGVQRGVGRLPTALLRGLLPEAVCNQDPARPSLVNLTRREREVLTLLARGHDRRDIAARLYCSPETVRTHIHSVLTKLNVHSTVEAVALAVRLGVEDE